MHETRDWRRCGAGYSTNCILRIGMKLSPARPSIQQLHTTRKNIFRNKKYLMESRFKCRKYIHYLDSQCIVRIQGDYELIWSCCCCGLVVWWGGGDNSVFFHDTSFISARRNCSLSLTVPDQFCSNCGVTVPRTGPRILAPIVVQYIWSLSEVIRVRCWRRRGWPPTDGPVVAGPGHAGHGQNMQRPVCSSAAAVAPVNSCLKYDDCHLHHSCPNIFVQTWWPTS